jgi:hypothetical protein
MKDMLKEALSGVDDFLAKNWYDTEGKDGILGVQEAAHNSIPGQVIIGTATEIGGYVVPVFDLAGYGYANIAEAAGLIDNTNPYYYAPFSTGMGEIGNYYAENVPAEMQRDISLLRDIGLIYGGAKVVAGPTIKAAKPGLKGFLGKLFGKKNPLKGTTRTPKVNKQISNTADQYHSFPESIDDMAGQGTVTKITGGDGVVRTKVELPEAINGKTGKYEWIIEPNNTINHRVFIPD